MSNGRCTFRKIVDHKYIDHAAAFTFFKKNTAIIIDELEENYFSFCNALDASEEITFSQFQQHIHAYILLDVRTCEEHSDFNIGGIHIPLNELPKRLKEIPQSKPLLVYCQSGMRSKQAITLLKKHHFTCSLFNLAGGLQA